MSIDLNQLKEILAAIAQTDITEFTLKSEEFELTVRKGIGEANIPSTNTVPPVQSVPLTAAPSPAVDAAPPTPISVPETPSPLPVENKWVAITSPMVGTFYRSPAPDESPFVEKGDRISKGQTVCIIEAMKLMNEIEAEVAGEVMEILVENGQPIEYGQNLMWVNPG